MQYILISWDIGPWFFLELKKPSVVDHGVVWA